MIPIKLALKKIARETGEDEYDIIIELKNLGIEIIASQIMIKHSFLETHAIIPFYLFQERELYKLLDSSSTFYILFLDDVLNLIFLTSIQKSIIDQEIFDELEYKHNINLSNMNEEEWEILFQSEKWISCEKQVFREIISDKIAKILNLKH